MLLKKCRNRIKKYCVYMADILLGLSCTEIMQVLQRATT